LIKHIREAPWRVAVRAEQHDRKVVNFYSHDTRVAAALVIATLGMCLVFPLIALIGVHSRQQIWQ